MPASPPAASAARLAIAAAVLALLAALAVRPFVAPAGARAIGPLPDCRYDDIPTTPGGYDDWSITLVDTILRVPRAYVPPDLVSVSEAGIAGKGKVRAFVIDDLRDVTDAAAAAGNPIGVQSAYRSYTTRESVFAGYVEQLGRKKALTVSARPGHSEHQLGLTVDFRSVPPVSTLSGTWASTPAGKWMKAHGWEYGFVMSYPKGAMDMVCYSFEPWHWRYVGRDLAAAIQSSGLTPREYLWANFTTAIVPPAPTPTNTPTKTAAPTLAPAASPTPTTGPPTPSPGPPTVAPVTSAPAEPSGPAAPTAVASPPATAPPAVGQAAAIEVVLAGAAIGAIAALLVLGLAVARRRGRSG